MKFAAYGIELERLTLDTAEILRQWRNNPDLNTFMDYRGQITVEMQKKWFQSINNVSNFFFLIKYDDLYSGMLHCSSINWQRKEGQSGILIFSEAITGTPIPVFASLALLDFSFNVLRLNKLFAKVHKENKMALNYNKKLNFEHASALDDNFDLYELTAENHLSGNEKLNRIARSVAGEEVKLILNDSTEDREFKETIDRLEIFS